MKKPDQELLDRILTGNGLKPELGTVPPDHTRMEPRHQAANFLFTLGTAWGVFGTTFLNTCMRWPGGPDTFFWTVQGYFAAVLGVATLRLAHFNHYARFCSTQARWQHELETVLLFNSLAGCLGFINLYAYTADWWPILFAFLGSVVAILFYMGTFWSAHKRTCHVAPGFHRYELYGSTGVRIFFNVIDALWVLSWLAFIVLVAQSATDVTLSGRPDMTNNSTACLTVNVTTDII